MKAELSTIGGVARAAGVNVETIRYYQRLGLLREPEKPLGAVRRYPPQAVVRLRFIKRAQQLGFSLEEVSALLRLNDGVHCRETRALAANKLSLVESRIKDLTTIRRTLKELVAECDAGNERESCPIIVSLLGDRNR